MKPSLAVFALSTLVFFTLLFNLSPAMEEQSGPYNLYSGDEIQPFSPSPVDFSLSLPNPQWIRAVQTNSNEEIRRLVKEGEYVDQAIDAHGSVALHVFAKRGNKEMVALLLENGANPHRLSQEGLSCFDYAQRGGYEEVAHLIQQFSLTSQEVRKKLQVASQSSYDSTAQKEASDNFIDTLLFPYHRLKSMIW